MTPKSEKAQGGVLDLSDVPSDSLVYRAELTGRHESYVEGFVPIELIYSGDVPVDEGHVEELGVSMEIEADKKGGDGQISRVVLGEVRGEPYFPIIDGFHRTEWRRENNFAVVRSSIRLDSTWEDVWDLRITTATTHKAVKFSRIVDWIDKIWQLSPWHEQLNAYQAFNLAARVSVGEKTLRQHGISQEDVEGIKEWATTKSQKWDLAVNTITSHLYTASKVDSALVAEAREGKGGYTQEHFLTPQHLSVFARTLPMRYELQHIVADAVKEQALSTNETKILAQIAGRAGNAEAVLEIIKAGEWRELAPKTTRVRSNLGSSNMAGREIRKMAIVDNLELARLALENTVLRGRYTAPPIASTPQRVDRDAKLDRALEIKDQDWPEEVIDSLITNLDSSSETLRQHLIDSFGASEHQADAILNAAGRRIVNDVRTGGLRYIKVNTKPVINNLLVACVNDEAVRASSDGSVPAELPRPTQQELRTLLGELTSDKVARSIFEIMSEMSPIERRVFTLGGIFNLSSKITSQVVQLKPEAVDRMLERAISFISNEEASLAD
jgi:DNA-directed RNA polymerase specialized sigma24 family protein